MPDLPKANYSVWVRGYGLVDSPKVRTAPGTTLNLKAVPAPSAAAAAQYYPAIYWYSMLKIPDKSEFPAGQGAQHQGEWLNVVKTNGCIACHALGTPGTRTMPKDFAHMKSSDAWARRIQSGQALTQMARDIARLETPRAFEPVRRLDRPHRRGRAAVREAGAAAGDRAQRRAHPVGLEHAHGLPARSDRDRPAQSHASTPTASSTASPEDSTDFVPVLDPNTHTASRDECTRCATRRRRRRRTSPMQPSPLLGRQADLGQQDQHPQPDDGREGPRLVHRAGAPSEQPGFLQEGLEPSVGEGVPARIRPRAISPCTTRRRASGR